MGGRSLAGRFWIGSWREVETQFPRYVISQLSNSPEVHSAGKVVPVSVGWFSCAWSGPEA
jgi:hypothetical protein